MKGAQFVLGTAAVTLIGDASMPVVVGVVAASTVFITALLWGKRGGRTAGQAALRVGALVSALSIVLVAIAAFKLGAGRSQRADVSDTVLGNLLPPDIRRTCSVVASRPESVASQLRCRDVVADVDLDVRQLTSTAALKRAAHRDAAGLPAGQCFVQTAAVGGYEYDARPMGSLACREDSSNRTLTWTNEKLRVLVRAQQPQAASTPLIAWWSDRRLLLSAANLRRRFPDELERRLMLTMDPRLARTCRRTNFSRPGSVAALECTAAGGTIAVVRLGFARPRDLQRVLATSTRAVRHASGSCLILGSAPAVARYARGTRVCYNDGRTSWVQWADDRALSYTFASRTRHSDLSLDTLYRWWRKHR